MSSFLQILIEYEKLHQLPARVNLFARRRLVDNLLPLVRI